MIRRATLFFVAVVIVAAITPGVDSTPVRIRVFALVNNSSGLQEVVKVLVGNQIGGGLGLGPDGKSGGNEAKEFHLN